MPYTLINNIAQPSENGKNNALVVSTAIQALENLHDGQFDFNLGTGDKTVDDTTNRTNNAVNGVWNLVGSISTTRTLIAPKRRWTRIVRGSTTGAGTPKVSLTAGGAGISVPSGSTKWLYCDGTTVYEVVLSAAPVPMSGATGSTPGTSGSVPAPAAGDNTKVLYGDGLWKTPSASADATSLRGKPISTTAPSVGDTLTFDGTEYKPAPSGGNTVVNGTLAGTVNGFNSVFTTSSNYVTGTTRLYLNGLRQVLGTHYTESSGNTITFALAPQSGDLMTIDYKEN